MFNSIPGFALLCALLGFTYGSYDSRWVPYPRYNKLSWGFATAIISLILTVVSFFTMLTFYLKVHAKKVKALLLQQQNGNDADDEVPEDDDKNVEDEIRKLASTSASRIYTHPNYQQVNTYEGNQRVTSEVIEDLGDLDDDGIYPYN